MSAVTVGIVLYGMGMAWSGGEEDRATMAPFSFVPLSVYEELARPGPAVLYVRPDLTSFQPPEAHSLQRPRSIILDRQFHLGGQVPVQTRFLFLPSEEQRTEDPLLRFQQRMEREYGPQDSPAEPDRLARSALQVGLEEKGPQGSLTASLASVGAEFDQDRQYGLERGTQQTALAGQYTLRPGLSVGSEFTQKERQAQGNPSREETWRNRMQYQPSASSQVQVAHERTQTQEGPQLPRLRETVKITGEQKFSEKAKLTLEQARKQRSDSSGERWEKETTAQFLGQPSRQLEVAVERKHQQIDQGTPETTQKVTLGYRPQASLSLKSRYTQEEKGGRQEQEREIEMEAQPGQDLKVKTRFEQERKRDDQFDTHSLEIEVTPGQGATLKTGYQEEEKSGGNRERTQTAELEFQPTGRWNVSGRYQEVDATQDPEKVTRRLAITHRAADWLTLTGAEEAELKDRMGRERTRRMGAESQFGGGLSLTFNREWREKKAEVWEVQSTQAAYRPSEALQFSGRHILRTDATGQAACSRQANLDLRPGEGWHFLGGLAENPENDQGQVTPGRQVQMQMDYEVASGLSLSGRSARQEDPLQQRWRQETELGLSLGSDTGRLFTRMRREQTLSLGRQFSTEYRLGYSRQIGSRLNWSLEGSLQRWGDRYGSVGNQQEEYRGEAKLKLSF